MKAYITTINDEYYLENPNGKPIIMSEEDIKSMLLCYEDFFNDNSVFQANNQYKVKGTLLAYISNEGKLNVISDEFLCDIFKGPVTYISSTEYAEKHEKDRSLVLRMCREGRFKRAKQAGARWLIPENEPYPTRKPRSKNK